MKKRLIETALFLALLAAILYGVSSYTERNAKIAALKESEAQIEKTIKELDTAYLLKIATQDKTIGNLEAQVKIYKAEREGIHKRMAEVEKKRAEIHKPVNDAELRQGLESMGYKTK